MFPLIIVFRILFVASMVFVTGYVFGNFSKRRTLSTISKVATILVIVLFIAANGILLRFGGWHRGDNYPNGHCCKIQQDSIPAR